MKTPTLPKKLTTALTAIPRGPVAGGRRQLKLVEDRFQPIVGPATGKSSWSRAHDAVVSQGEFTSLTHSEPCGSREYKLYIPSSYAGRPLPLIVMLHGAQQDPDDFAQGTRMNELAEERGFLVAYPAQTARANAFRCWNWFDAEQQTRSGTEPTLIVGIVEEIAGTYALDRGRVFVAGLSAGAAMAVILGQTHPDIFAGVAAHSGLPLGAAQNVYSALAAMRGRSTSERSTGGSGEHILPTPTIVLHGDADHMVAPENGAAIGDQAVDGFESAGIKLRRGTVKLRSAGSQCETAITFKDSRGRTLVSEIIVQGAGHAWFGGSASGSYTDLDGPDASSEIVSFFEGLPVANHVGRV